MALRMEPPDQIALFAALADRTRLRLLNLMAGGNILEGGEVCVCYFVEILSQSQPKISRHLAYLRRAGIVAARREGKWMHYRIVPPKDRAAKSILAAVGQMLLADPEMRADLLRMNSACCAPQKFVALRGAPKPVRAAAASGARRV